MICKRRSGVSDDGCAGEGEDGRIGMGDWSDWLGRAVCKEFETPKVV